MTPPLALWMPYMAVLMALAAVLAELSERLLRFAGRQARTVWLAALVCSPIFAIVASSGGNHRSTAQRSERELTSVAEDQSATARTTSTRRLTLPMLAVTQDWSPTIKRLENPLRWFWAGTSGLMLLTVTVTTLRVRARTARARRSVLDGVPVRIDDSLGPAASPFHGGEIIVPTWLESVDTSLRGLVLTHEQQHLRTADPIVLFVATAIVALFPWSPAAWWMLKRLRLAIEVDCDNRTVERHSAHGVDERQRYARLLILAAQHHAEKQRPFGASVVLSAASSHLSRRLHMLSNPIVRPTRARVLSLIGATLAVTTLAFAMPRPSRGATEDQQPRDIAGLYWMQPPTSVPSDKMLAPGREFTYLRLASDGRSRMENVLVDAKGSQIAPKVEVGPWNSEKWQLRTDTKNNSAMLCWPLGAQLLCHPFVRDTKSGDITLYNINGDGKVAMVLQKAADR